VSVPQRPQIDGGDTPDEETLAFEAEVVRSVTASVAAGLDELIRVILSAYEATAAVLGGSLTDEQARDFGRRIGARIEALTWTEMRPALGGAAIEAHRLGVARAAERFASPADQAKARTTKTPRRRKTIPIDANLRADLRAASKIAKAGVKTASDAAAVAGKVKAGKNRAQGAARWTANEGINAGTADVARKMDLRLLWVAERNACLHCLAHAGYVVAPGALFPGLSFDPAASNIPAVEFPPLHPNCRCQCRTTDAPAGPPPRDRSSLNPAARLAAEARRSVVYQWTDHASEPAAIRAAEALLSAGADLPASVEARARAQVRAAKRRRT
jgi:hypothetical protein